MHAEEVKKNEGKYTPIPNRSPPSKLPELVSEYAIRKTANGAYIGMWYYTNSGIEEAKRSTGTVDDETLVLSWNPDSSSSLVPAGATKEGRGVVDDEHFKWEDFCQAVPRMVRAMEIADWQPERVTMLAACPIMGKSDGIRLRSTPIPWIKELYSFTKHSKSQRRSWHRAITSPEGAWNIGIMYYYGSDRFRKRKKTDECTHLFLLVFQFINNPTR